MTGDDFIALLYHVYIIGNIEWVKTLNRHDLEIWEATYYTDGGERFLWLSREDNKGIRLAHGTPAMCESADAAYVTFNFTDSYDTLNKIVMSLKGIGSSIPNDLFEMLRPF